MGVVLDEENSCKKLFSSSSWESRDSIEEFYEEIEAPKFVDFTLPNHYCPDDHYWFCQRVGCNQNHEDSEAIYNNFVLRVMAARSPNIRLRRAMDRNASRIPIKCPLSAPPKSSKPRVSRMALISSISEKTVDEKKKVVSRSLLKPNSTPVTTKTKPVAAKYLTTPRNKNCLAKKSPFRSVQNPKPTDMEVSKCQTVAKALVFRSPKKVIKVKTSLELRTPVRKLCEGMNKLEISSQSKSKSGLDHSSKPFKVLSNNASRRLLGGRKMQSKPEEPVNSQTSGIKNDAKSVRNHNSTSKGKLLKQHVSKKLLGSDPVDLPITNDDQDDNKQSSVTGIITEESDVQESRQEDTCVPSEVPQSTNNMDLAAPDDAKERKECLDFEGTNILISQDTNIEENNGSDTIDLNGSTKLTSESYGHSVGQLHESNSSQRERNRHDEYLDSDDKENAAATDENRMHSSSQAKNGRTIFGIHKNGGEVKKVVQIHDKQLKGSQVSSGPVMKFKKPKPTNPKPFRLRTDERGILREANLEKRIKEEVSAQSETANSSTLSRKLPKKQTNDAHIESLIVDLKTLKEQKKSEVEVFRKEKPNKMNSPVGSNSVRRLKNIKKASFPLQKQGLQSSKKETAVALLIPGQKLDVIYETSPEVSQLKVGKPTERGIGLTTDVAARSSSRGKQRPVTVAVEPKFSSSHVPRSCTKKLK